MHDEHFPEPDLRWYLKKSREQKLPPRCPIAAQHLCPRYDDTLDRLAQAKKIVNYTPPKVPPDYDLLAPTEPYSTGADGKIFSFAATCPEVMAEVVGLFVSGYSYPEICSGECGDQWHEWYYYRNARHYSECREYSIWAGHQNGKQGMGQKRKRKGLAPGIRWKILQRDGFRCVYCGQGIPAVVLQVDHKIAVANGGSDDIDNLVTSCRDCNQGKGAT